MDVVLNWTLIWVSKDNVTPKSTPKSLVFHYKPSILGYPYFLETPTCCFMHGKKIKTQLTQRTLFWGENLFFGGAETCTFNLMCPKHYDCKTLVGPTKRLSGDTGTNRLGREEQK